MNGPELMELGSPGPLRDQLVDAVMRGEKTATTSLAAQYAQAGEPLPRPGTRKLLVDSDERGVGEVEIVEVSVLPLGEADLQLAHDEGEGFTSVSHWREAPEDFWRAEILPELGLTADWLDDTIEVVVERFRYLGPRA